jgi:hypothetical protein
MSPALDTVRMLWRGTFIFPSETPARSASFVRSLRRCPAPCSNRAESALSIRRRRFPAEQSDPSRGGGHHGDEAPGYGRSIGPGRRNRPPTIGEVGWVPRKSDSARGRMTPRVKIRGALSGLRSPHCGAADYLIRALFADFGELRVSSSIWTLRPMCLIPPDAG